MHCGYVVKVEKLRPHSNADRLLVATFFGNDTCVSLETKVGDLGIYFPCDNQLSLDFCIKNHLLRKLPDGTPDTGYMDADKRNVSAIRLRGEKSDGLYLPITCLESFGDITKLRVGDTIDTFNGHLICQKYIPRRNPPRTSTRGGNKVRKKKVKEITLPYFSEHIDTPQLRFCADIFKPGDIICLTEKVHGTSSRNAYTLQISYKKSLLDKIFHRKGKEIYSYKEAVGTRRTTINDVEGGYYGSHQFRIDWNDKFKNKLIPGEEVFGEIAGWINENTTIMGIANNKKTNDKEFIKKYGNTTTFSYGCEKGKSRFFIYRMTYTSPEGYVIEYPWDLVQLRAEQMGFEVVPELDRFIYTTEEEFNNRISKWLDIPSTLDPHHIIEGVVVRALNATTFKVAKEKSFNFKVIEGIIKSEAECPDIEEAEEI